MKHIESLLNQEEPNKEKENAERFPYRAGE